MITARQLRRLERRTKDDVLNQMRKDLKYLIKPRPRFLPNFMWIAILRKLLNLNQ